MALLFCDFFGNHYSMSVNVRLIKSGWMAAVNAAVHTMYMYYTINTVTMTLKQQISNGNTVSFENCTNMSDIINTSALQWQITCGPAHLMELTVCIAWPYFELELAF